MTLFDRYFGVRFLTDVFAEYGKEISNDTRTMPKFPFSVDASNHNPDPDQGRQTGIPPVSLPSWTGNCHEFSIGGDCDGDCEDE